MYFNANFLYLQSEFIYSVSVRGMNNSKGTVHVPICAALKPESYLRSLVQNRFAVLLN